MEIVKKQEPEKPQYGKVEMREPKVKDMIDAQRASGANEGAKFEAALLAQVCTFDGNKLTMEDIEQMSLDDFFRLKDTLFGGALTALAQQLLSLQNTPVSDPKQS